MYKPEGDKDKLWTNWKDLFCDSFIRVDREVGVFADFDKKGNPIGRIDYTAALRKHLFVIEAKLEKTTIGSTLFWKSFKVIGYRRALALDQDRDISSLKAMVFLPRSTFLPEYGGILNAEKIDWVLFDFTEEGWIPASSSVKRLIKSRQTPSSLY